ncbi:hypothetical protein F4806DRAFT_505590 [Annulohypoxylon nitens]|nr:hypothetical protein F4806DRAFT_505590 [Annulohypoxylon nitens]
MPKRRNEAPQEATEDLSGEISHPQKKKKPTKPREAHGWQTKTRKSAQCYPCSYAHRPCTGWRCVRCIENSLYCTLSPNGRDCFECLDAVEPCSGVLAECVECENRDYICEYTEVKKPQGDHLLAAVISVDPSIEQKIFAALDTPVTINGKTLTCREDLLNGQGDRWMELRKQFGRTKLHKDIFEQDKPRKKDQVQPAPVDAAANDPANAPADDPEDAPADAPADALQEAQEQTLEQALEEGLANLPFGDDSIEEQQDETSDAYSEDSEDLEDSEDEDGSQLSDPQTLPGTGMGAGNVNVFTGLPSSNHQPIHPDQPPIPNEDPFTYDFGPEQSAANPYGSYPTPATTGHHLSNPMQYGSNMAAANSTPQAAPHGNDLSSFHSHSHQQASNNLMNEAGAPMMQNANYHGYQNLPPGYSPYPPQQYPPQQYPPQQYPPNGAYYYYG